MSSVESDFADHPGDGSPGGFIVWLVPVLWPFIIVRLLLAMVPTSPSPQTPGDLSQEHLLRGHRRIRLVVAGSSPIVRSREPYRFRKLLASKKLTGEASRLRPISLALVASHPCHPKWRKMRKAV